LATFIKKIWSAAPVATVVLGLALSASLFFGVRSVVFLVTHPPRSERAQTVATWMTPRFIARSWHIPQRVILRAIDAPEPPPDGPMSLTELAEFRGVPIAQVIAEVEAAISDFRPEKPAPRRKPGTKGEPAND
jgi:hypothetical protein